MGLFDVVALKITGTVVGTVAESKENLEHIDAVVVSAAYIAVDQHQRNAVTVVKVH